MVEINRIIDLTTNNFGRVNFEEAEILKFDYFDNVEFELWGARLLVDDFWDHDKSFLQGVPHSDDYYVAGIGKIKIQQVLGSDMFFYPYIKVGDLYEFLYDSNGKKLKKDGREVKQRKEITIYGNVYYYIHMGISN